MLHRHAIWKVQQIGSKIIIYFQDTDNVLFVNLMTVDHQCCFDDAEVDTLNGMRHAFDLQVHSEYVYMVTTQRQGVIEEDPHVKSDSPLKEVQLLQIYKIVAPESNQEVDDELYQASHF